MSKNDPPLLGSKIMNLLVFFIFSPKSVSGSQLHGVCMGQGAKSAHVVHALFSHYCYVGGVGDVGDPVLPTLRDVSGDIVTIYAYLDTKGRFFAVCSLTQGWSKPVPKT